jgi:hypothetical protein
MAPRRKVRAREAQLAFEALAIEGGLLSPEWLSKVAQLQAAHQAEADYRIPKGLALRDEIGRFWRIAQAHWSDFKAGREKQAEATALADSFILGLLRDAFGFGSIAKADPEVLGDRTYPIGHRALEGRVPVVVAPAASGLDVLSPAFGEDGRRRSAFGLAQEYLNADDRALWGLATDGLTLRLCRDNASLTRPAWLEADLGRIFTEERYADFAALWLLIQESRFGAPGQPVTDCPLELWRSAGREEGTRAREKLRGGVEDALVALGRGFLTHADNQALRAALHGGQLTRDAYFQQLLRLVYRVIFLLTAEERAVLHPPDAAQGARELYEKGYSLRRLRDRSAKRSAHDRFGDLWEGLKITFRGVATGEPRLSLPALGGLFAKDQCPDLDGAKLENRWLMVAIFKLAWVREESGLARVNWRDMGPEELGSVYESLLELVPIIPQDGRGFSFATGDETKGNARKTTGSYYTPDGLVQVLLESALEPVIKATVAAHPEDPAEALLNLAIVDPACGSGHFLLAAARRLAVHVARHQANGTPSAEQYRHAVRQVVSRCLFGVDLNPMAVELCRVSLWMEAVEPGRPLSFLDSHVQRGNALFGATPELMRKGVPDAAFEPIEGDDKKTASLLKKRNKEVSEKQGLFDTLWSKQAGSETEQVARAVAELDAASDADLAAVVGKEVRWEELKASDAFRHQRFVADTWCAAFVWPKPEIESAAGGKQKKASPIVEAAPTNALWLQIQSGKGQAPALTVKTVEELAAQHQFFHWHLAFPQVFARGGFDVVIGNPPWERVKLQEQEFFASRHDGIASAPNAAARKRLIATLGETDPALLGEWVAACRQAEGGSHFMRQSGRYPLCGKGDVNTYALFAELNREALGSTGRAGFIVPTGIATDDSTKDYFGALVDQRQLASFYSFENEEFVFPAVHHAFRFALLTVDRSGTSSHADLVFFARQVAALGEPQRHFSLAPDDFAALNPNTRTCPTFRSSRDAALNLAIYKRAGVLWREADADGNPWNVRFMAMVHMANDSGLFRTEPVLRAEGYRLVGNRFERGSSSYVPLLEAKMLHLFDHRFGTYEGQTPAQANQGKLPEFSDLEHADPDRLTLPEYWVPAAEVEERLGERSTRQWLIGWRKIARSTDQRTLIASLTPRAATGDSYYVITSDQEPSRLACMYANMSALVLDYAARQKVGGSNFVYHTFRQLPLLAPQFFDGRLGFMEAGSAREWIIPRVVELTYTAWDLEPFAKDVGHTGPPFRWSSHRRFLLRAELDAAFIHFYAIARDDADYILDTFPVVRKNDEKAHGEYRTKRVVLEVYDAMAEAIRTGKPYQTRLDPPPADPRMAHRAKVTVGVLRTPRVRPKIAAIEADARFLWACLYASGGTVRTRDLARAYSLRSHPTELARLSPDTVGAEAREWAKRVKEDLEGHRSLRALLSELEARGAVRMDADSSGGLIKTGQHTPSEDQIDEWSVFEATLALRVLSALPASEVKGVDSQIAPDDRSLLIAKGA